MKTSESIDKDFDPLDNITSGLSESFHFLAENYTHKYKTYWVIEDQITKTIIKKVKDEMEGITYAIRCGCIHRWKVLMQREPEHLLSKRTEIKREQYQGSHKPLDTFDKNRDLEVQYDLADHRRIGKLIKKDEISDIKRTLKKRQANGQSMDILIKTHETDHFNYNETAQIALDEIKLKEAIEKEKSLLLKSLT